MRLLTPVRCLDDVDDEVRDRAAMYVRVFKEKPLADAYVKEGMFLFYINTFRATATSDRISIFSGRIGIKTCCIRQRSCLCHSTV